MKDKQVYRDMEEVTPEALQQVKRNFEWIADKLDVSCLPLLQYLKYVLVYTCAGSCRRISGQWFCSIFSFLYIAKTIAVLH